MADIRTPTPLPATLDQTLAPAPAPDPNAMQSGPSMPKNLPPASPAPRPQQGRLAQFESFLGDFIYALGQGMSAQGSGPGSFSRGFGAAVQAPVTRQFQQSALQQQSAESEQRRAQANLTNAQANMGTAYIPGIGQVSAPMATLGNVLKGSAAAAINTQGRTEQTKITAENRLDVERMKMQFQAGLVARVIPAVGADGTPVMRAFNKFNQPMGDIDGALIPQMLPKQSSTVEYKQMDDGSIVALPKTTVTQPVVPGGGKVGGGVATGKPVTGANGQPLLGKGAITSATRQMVETAPKVMSLVDRLRGQIQDLQKSGDLGPGASRWSDFWSGKVGTENPKFRAMKTNADLLSTLLMRMHVGARGGELIMQHFDNILGAGHQSADNMLSALDQITQYAQDVKGAAPLPAGEGSFNLPQGNGGAINPVIAKQYLDASGGDKDKARALAKKNGWKF